MTYQASKQSSKKTDFIIDLIWWGLLRLVPISVQNNNKRIPEDFISILKLSRKHIFPMAYRLITMCNRHIVISLLQGEQLRDGYSLLVLLMVLVYSLVRF